MKNKAGDQSIVRIANQKSIIEYIRTYGPTSKADLSRLLKISKPTVAKNVEILIEEGILYVYGEGKSSGGRRPLLIGFNEKYQYVLVLNININYPIIALFNLKGKIVQKYKLSINENIKEYDFLDKIYVKIDELMDSEVIDKSKIGVITVSTPGIINEETGEIDANPQFKEWKSINLYKELYNRFDKKVIIKNDISMAALGEKYYGIGKNYKQLIYVASTFGLGAGLILNSKLYEGKRKAAGEIGYFKMPGIDKNLEELFSVPNILSKIGNELEKYPNSLINELTSHGKNDVTIEMVEEAIKSADEYILMVLDEVAEYYGMAITNICSLLDLECVIIGGSLSKLGISFIHRLKEIVFKYSPVEAEILLSSLNENANLYGGYIIGNEYLSKKLIN